jgi:hypothetical protein
LAAGFVGVEAVVADGLLALGWEVEEGGGDEVGGLEDLEVALGGVVAFGAVDDGLAGGVPGDFLLRGVDSGDGPDAAVGEAEADPEGVLEGGDGGVEEEGEKVDLCRDLSLCAAAGLLQGPAGSPGV